MFDSGQIMPFLGDVHKTFWFPEQASTFAPEIDSFYYAILYISYVFFFLIIIPMGYFMWKYRMRPGYKGSPEALHNNALEITWTIIPTFIVVWIFARGTVGYLDMAKPPEGELLEIKVQAQKWAWSFEYPNGAIDTNLHLPRDKAVKLTMRSDDVLHSLFVPAFRAKTDVVPGRYNVMWFEPTKNGEYDLFCTEYCGDKHSQMVAKTIVHDQADYVKWVLEAAKPPVDPVEHGKWLYERRGCKSCHSIDGKKVIGPSFKGGWGKEVVLAKGSPVRFDENYVRTSILDPQAMARDGYQTASAMPSYQGRLKEKEIMALIEFMKSLKD
jgi:cytochrome c oxidase subunit II